MNFLSNLLKKRKRFDPYKKVFSDESDTWTDYEKKELRSLFREDKGIRLKDIQCEALLTLKRYSGLFAPIGVGHGKTIISLLAGKVLDKPMTILLVPPDIIEQTEKDAEAIKEKLHPELDYISINQWSRTERRSYDFSKKNLVIFPYSFLSISDSYELLYAIQPDLIVADEAQNLKNTSSAKTKRIMKLLNEHPGIDFVCLSGTITKKSIFDYVHLIKRCLREESPLPTAYLDLVALDEALTDPYHNFISIENELLRRYVERCPSTKAIAEKDIIPQEKMRKAFAYGLVNAPGVVATDGQAVDASIYIYNKKKEVPTVVDDKLSFLEDTWVNPSGDEIPDILGFYRTATQLASGFYTRLLWPENTSTEALEQHLLLNRLNAAIRKWLNRRSRPGLDTEGLILKALADKSRGVKSLQVFYDEYIEARDACAFIPKRIRSVTWVSKYKIKEAVAWKRPGIIWYYWDAMGRALSKAMPEAIYCPAGKPLKDMQNPNSTLICSILAHHTGKNLQHFHEQLVVEVPTSAAMWEQLLGRTHRLGQESDTVETNIIAYTNFEQKLLKNVINQAQYIQGTGAGSQKILIADWEHPLTTKYNKL